MLAARTGKTDAVKVLFDHGAKSTPSRTSGRDDRVDVGRFRGHSTRPSFSSPTVPMWMPAPICPSTHGYGFEGATPVPPKADETPEEQAGGWMTPLMFAARKEIWRSLDFGCGESGPECYCR